MPPLCSFDPPTAAYANVIDLLLILTLALHLVAMNVAGAAPLVCIGLDRVGLDRESPRYRVGRQMANLSLMGLLIGVLLGLGAGTMLWLGGHTRFFIALKLLTRQVQFGMAEMVFTWACYIGYIVWWRLGPRTKTWQRLLHALLAFLGATNLLYHFPTLFAVMGNLAARVPGTEMFVEQLTHDQFMRLVYTQDVLSRWLHFLLASFAVAGLLLSIVAVRQREGDEARQRTYNLLAAWGARVALVCTILQMIVGPWVMLAVPGGMQQRLMGGSLLATGSLLAGILFSVGLMHHLAGIAGGEVKRQAVVRSASLMLMTILLMTAALHYSRGDSLQDDTPEPIPAGPGVELVDPA